MIKWMCVLLMLCLTGCGTQETFETVADELIQPVMAQPRLVCVELPGEAALPVFENDNGRVYICNDYEIVLQTLVAGDLEQTMRTITGMEREDLTVMETASGGVARHEFVWAAAGETGEQLGRGVILDDGNYHYCLSVLHKTDPEEKTQISWDRVFASFCLA